MVKTHSGLKYKKARWTSEEDELLLYLKNEKKINNWNTIANYFDSKNSKQCMYRYRKIFVKKTIVKFSNEDDQRLLNLVEKYGENFSLFLPHFQGKREKDLIHRYYKKLNPSSLVFTPEEDELILQLYHNRELHLNQMNFSIYENDFQNKGLFNIKKGYSSSSIDQVSKINLLKTKAVTAIQKRLEFLLKHSGEEIDKSFNISSIFSSSMSSSNNNKSNDTFANTVTGSTQTLTLKQEIENDLYVFNHKKFTQINNDDMSMNKSNNFNDYNNNYNDKYNNNNNFNFIHENPLLNKFNTQRMNNSVFMDNNNINLNLKFENECNDVNFLDNNNKLILVDENGNEEEYFYKSPKCTQTCFDNNNVEFTNLKQNPDDQINVQAENNYKNSICNSNPGTVTQKLDTSYLHLNQNQSLNLAKTDFEDFEKNFYEIFKSFDNTDDDNSKPDMIFGDIENDLNMSFVNMGNLTNEIINHEDFLEPDIECTDYNNNIHKKQYPNIIIDNSSKLENNNCSLFKSSNCSLNYNNQDNRNSDIKMKGQELENINYRGIVSKIPKSKSYKQISNNNAFINCLEDKNDSSIEFNLGSKPYIQNKDRNNQIFANNELYDRRNLKINNDTRIPSHIYNDNFPTNSQVNNKSISHSSSSKNIDILIQKKQTLENILNRINEVSSLFCTGLQHKLDSQYTDPQKKTTFISLLTKVEEFECYFKLKFKQNKNSFSSLLENQANHNKVVASLQRLDSKFNKQSGDVTYDGKVQKELFSDIDLLIKLIKIIKLKIKLFKCLYAVKD